MSPPADNTQAFMMLQKHAETVQFGSINTQLQVHDGKIVGIMGENFIHRKYDKCVGDTLAYMQFVRELNECREKKETGTITGTFRLHNGNITELFIQTSIKESSTP